MVLLGTFGNRNKVMVSAREVSALEQERPGSGLPHLRVIFEFSPKGDLIGLVAPNDWTEKPGIDRTTLALLISEGPAILPGTQRAAWPDRRRGPVMFGPRLPLPPLVRPLRTGARCGRPPRLPAARPRSWRREMGHF